MPKYYTVVYEYDDTADPERITSITEGFKTMSEKKIPFLGGIRIAGCADGDALTQSIAYAKALIMAGEAPSTQLVNFLQDEHPDGLSRGQAASLANSIAPA